MTLSLTVFFFFEISFTWFETVLRLTFKESKSMLINKCLEIAMMIFEIECACLKLGVFLMIVGF